MSCAGYGLCAETLADVVEVNLDVVGCGGAGDGDDVVATVICLDDVEVIEHGLADVLNIDEAVARACADAVEVFGDGSIRYRRKR